MNIVALTGRLTKEIEIRVSQSGKKYTRFSLAVRKSKEDTTFIDCLAWETTADMLKNYVGKGNMVGVSGYIDSHTYDKQDGTKGKSTEVIVTTIDLIESKKKEEQPVPTQSNQPLDIDDYDLPF